MQRNLALRLMEPLGAPENESTGAVKPGVVTGAVTIRMEALTVRASGSTILNEVSLEIPAGSHVAIVGPSGAGKSSLVGLLLGWHKPASGSLTIDGVELDAAGLDALRGRTAWVDPQVQLWNRSLFENLRYGAGANPPAMDAVLQAAELEGVLTTLPDGLATRLGEGGGMLSGGEGQRVRLGRAISRSEVGLAILDEPACGLDRERRRAMLESARERWKNSTLLSITHDVGDTLGFPRVLVIENGGIVEDGDPRVLAAQTDSRYRQLLDAEDEVRHGLWSSAQWRRLRIANGKVVESDRKGAYAGHDR
jgi:ATP-binding cassette subfamily B protein